MNFNDIFKTDAAHQSDPPINRDDLEKDQEAGRPLNEIFLELCEGVSLMTGEPLFLKAVKGKFNRYKTE